MADNGWAEVMLEDVAGELTVGHVGSMTSEYVGSGIPFLRSKNVEPFGIDWNDMRYIRREFHERLKKSALSPGDVVIVRTGKPGATAIIPDSLPEANCSDLVIVRPGPGLDARFLVYYLNSVATHHVNAHLVGAVQQHFNVGSARKLRMLLPPLPEQKAIARILGTLDDKIELNRRMNETLEGMARAIFKSWFVDFDPVRAKMDGRPVPGLDPATAELFPDGFEHVDGELVPKGWKVGRIRDLCEKIENGGTPKRHVDEYWSPPEVPWLTSGEVRLGYIVTTENFISSEGLASSSAKMWSPFTTVVALYGATAGFASLLGMELCANQACCALIPKVHATCFNFLRASSSMAHFSQQTRGSAQQNLSQTLVAELPTLIPEENVLRVFDEKSRPLLARCFQNLLESASLAALRDALLPKLLSGEIRVADAETHVEAAIDGTESVPPSKPADTHPKIQNSTAQVKTPSAARAPSIKRQTPTLAAVDLDTDEVMCAFRQAARGQGELERERLLSLVARRLGYGRLGRNIRHTLKGHLRAAIRRRIIAANGQTAWAETAAMSDYDRDELGDTLRSVMRKNTEYARDEVIERVARHLGFARVRETVAAPIKSAINAAIRRGVLGGNQRMVWREE